MAVPAPAWRAALIRWAQDTANEAAIFEEEAASEVPGAGHLEDTLNRLRDIAETLKNEAEGWNIDGVG